MANGHDHAQKEGTDNNNKTEMVPVGQQKGDGMYYIVSPEFTGGLGNREARALFKLVRPVPDSLLPALGTNRFMISHISNIYRIDM